MCGDDDEGVREKKMWSTVSVSFYGSDTNLEPYYMFSAMILEKMQKRRRRIFNQESISSQRILVIPNL